MALYSDGLKFATEVSSKYFVKKITPGKFPEILHHYLPFLPEIFDLSTG